MIEDPGDLVIQVPDDQRFEYLMVNVRQHAIAYFVNIPTAADYEALISRWTLARTTDDVMELQLTGTEGPVGRLHVPARDIWLKLVSKKEYDDLTEALRRMRAAQFVGR